MNNSLRKISQDLRAFAKRTKDFKYTESALITFLMTGLVFSASISLATTQDTGIKNQVNQINTSIGQIRTDFKRARKENNKLVKDTNLELTKLMEQGDHVVKSPWSSWQFGINEFYNDWGSTYKGKGNKVSNIIYQRDKSLKKYIAKPVDEKTANNTTTLRFAYEPNAEIPISASITPKSISKVNPNIKKNVTITGLPSFEPRVVKEPLAPEVAVPVIPEEPNFTISATSNGNNTGPAFDEPNDERVMDGVAITGGDFYIKRNNANSWTYYYKNYTGKNAWYNGPVIANGVSITAGSPLPSSNRGSSTSPVTVSPMYNGFQRLVGNDLKAATMLSNGKFNYSRTGNNSASGILGEFAHLDLHGGADVNDQLAGLKSATNGLPNENLILNSYADALSKINSTYTTASVFSGTGNSLTATTAGSNAQTWINSGTIIGEGSNLSITNSYDHDRRNHHRAVVINTGDITLQPYEENSTKYEAFNAGFVVSDNVAYHSPHNDNSDPRQQTLYNSGNMNSYTKTTAMFFLDSSVPRPIVLINRGKIKMFGESSVGVYVKRSENLELSFTGKTDGTSINSGTDYNPVELFGDKNIGLFIPNQAASSNVKGTFAVNIGDTAGTSNTLFSSTSTQGTPITNYDINSTNGRTTTVKNYSKNSYITKKIENTDIQGSVGIYSYGSLDLQGHQIRIYDKTDGNVGVYSANSSAVYNLGDGTMLLERGKNNTAIAVGVNKGKVISKSEITLTDGVGNVGIYAAAAGSKRTGATPTETVTAKSITSTGTVNSIGIYADKGAYVELSDGMSMKNASVSNDPIKSVTDTSGEKFGGENSGAVYATGSNTKVVIDQANKQTSENIDINGKEIVEISSADGSKKKTGDYAGFGLYADGGAIIEAKNNYVKVTNGGTAVASTGSSSEVNLNQGTVEYDGKGYALYSKNGGQIKLTNGKLILKGEATGFSVDASVSPSSQPVKLTGSTVDMQSDDAILMSIKNANSLKTTGIAATLLGYSGLNPTDVSSSNGKNYYKIAVLDKSKIDIDGAGIDKSDATTGSDSEVFTRRLLIQNSILDVSSKVMAHLNKSQITAIDSNLTVPVGLAVSASENSIDTTTTGVNVKNGATITVDRTDSGNGGVGAYVNYGRVHNEGKIEVEKLTPNDHAVGIYATNGTEVNNDTTGTVDVGGKDSIGILGLSYRIDSKNNVVYEKFGTTGTTKTALINDKIGIVDVKNNGKITLDGDNSLGIYAKNNSVDAAGTNADYLRNDIANTKATNNGEITMTGKNAIGMIIEGGIATNDTKGKITISGQEGVAMYGTAITGKGMTGYIPSKIHSELNNKGTIDLADTTTSTPIIGMFTNDADTDISTSGTINVGKKSYGIYGASNTVTMSGGTINVGDDGVGIFATGSSDSEAASVHSDVDLIGGTINVGNNQAVGVFIADDAAHSLKTTVRNTGTNMTVGTNAFGYVVDSKTGTELDLGANGTGPISSPLTASIGTDSVYAYTNDKTGSVFSNTNITTTGGKSYGIYAAGEAVNYGTIDLTGGTGNVGIYSTGTSASGVGATNRGTINVGSTNVASKEYGIGMATGYYNETTGAISNEGLIENRGTINVLHENSIGMYAVGSGSKAINHGTIDISGKNATGMYIDHGAEGINYGTIKSTGSAKGIKGVATVNGGYIKNYGTISITSPDGIGIYQDAASALSQKNVPGNVSGTKANVYSATSTDQKYIVTPKGTLLIQNPPKTPRLTINGKEVALAGLDTNVASPTPSYVTAGATTLDLSLPQFADFKNSVSNAQATELGMYVDTSGVNYTHPIEGLSNLVGLDNINLIIGTEASKYTNAKAIEIGSNILDPYNSAISSLTTTGTKLNINSAGLTWLAQPLQGKSTPIEKLYMIKIPYTFFTSEKDENSYNFLDGLEQRYGVEGLGSRERQIFDKLNGIGKGETELFTQAVDEMKGHQYSNTQQRINATGNTLDKEFKYLRDEWRNPSKQNNKIKAFGMRDEYNTDTAGVIDYTSNAYGVAYIHEDEKIKMGNSTGWYAGAVTNRFKFKDIGKSKEDQTMLKLGVFKRMSPKKDYNGSLQWIVSGDVFAGINNMKRKFWVVDDVFEAKSNYNSYGAALKNELGYDIRMSERTHLRPYGSLKMEYGRFNNIKEDSGQMRLEVKGNDYFSVKPEAGVEFKYVQPLAVRTNLTVGLAAAYEDELGKLQSGNQARVRYTTAGWYNLEKEKEDRRGNGKFDLNIGIDNTRFGVTVNAGYDTKGSNVRGGIGFRAIY